MAGAVRIASSLVALAQRKEGTLSKKQDTLKERKAQCSQLPKAPGQQGARVGIQVLVHGAGAEGLSAPGDRDIPLLPPAVSLREGLG